MATILLIIIYIAFIGLGIPDSLFGAAWPAIYTEFHLPVSYASYVTLVISCGTVISSLVSARVINRFGVGAVTTVSTFLTAAALLGFSFSQNMLWFFLFAIPLGIGAGAIDTGLNNYVALHYRATHMNFLHCFYGVGVSVSPYLLSLVLSGGATWRDGYRLAVGLQTAIAVITLFALPLWGKIKGAQIVENAAPPRTVKLRELVKMPAVRAVWLVFIACCAIESSCGIWGSTFLVGAKGMSVDKAAATVTLFYIGMAIGRFLSGVLAAKLTGWQIIKIALGILAAALIALVLPLPAAVSGVGLFLIGLGNGPLFPNLTHLTPQNFGREISQSVIGTQMAASYLSIMLSPLLFGVLAEHVNVSLFPWYLFLMLILLILSTVLLCKSLQKQKAA